MIFAHLDDCGRFEPLHPLFKQFFDAVKELDFTQVKFGKMTISDDISITCLNAKCMAQNEQVLETHREFIDIHILLEGRERIGWKSASSLQTCIKPYVAQGDFTLWQDSVVAFIDLRPLDFVILFPEDAHAPRIGSGYIRKLVGKIRLQPSSDTPPATDQS